MELLQTLKKEHDELRQGEVFSDATQQDQFTKHFYIESYGCAMNFADSEVVASILAKNGFGSNPQPRHQERPFYRNIRARS